MIGDIGGIIAETKALRRIMGKCDSRIIKRNRARIDQRIHRNRRASNQRASH